MAPSRNAGPSDLKLFEAWMELTQRLLARTAKFPKHFRHTLTERIDRLALQILEDLTSAAYQHDKQRKLLAVNDQLNRLRVMLRLAHEMQLLSHAAYEELVHGMAEAGRMLGAWQRQQRTAHQTVPVAPSSTHHASPANPGPVQQSAV